MLRASYLLALTAALSLLMPSSAQAQPCRTASDSATSFVLQTKSLYAQADSAELASQGHPYASASAISLVTDSLICATAVATYNQEARLSLASVYVVQIGNTGYAVINPEDVSGEYTMLYIYDSSWNLKAVMGA